MCKNWIHPIVLIVILCITVNLTHADLIAYWPLDGDLTDFRGINNGSFVDAGGGIVTYATGFNGESSGALDFGGTANQSIG